MILFIEANRQVRDNGAIYEGYGYKHTDIVNSSVLEKYGIKQKFIIILGQCIGEALIAFKDGILKKPYDSTESRFYRKLTADAIEEYFLHFEPDEMLQKKLGLDTAIKSYKVKIAGKKLEIAAYTADGAVAEEDTLKPYYKFLFVLMTMVGMEICINDTFAKAMNDFAEKPSKEKFIHCYYLFQKKYKKTSFNDIRYEDLSYLNINANWHLEYPIKQKNETIGAGLEAPLYDYSRFSERLQKHIPPYKPELVLPIELEKIALAVKNGDIRTLLLHGPAGTGKTSACKLLGQAIGLPVVSINCTDALDEFVLGKFIPVDGKIVFDESDVTLAIREGAIVVFEEINFARPQYLAFLNSLLDDNGHVRLDNNTFVKRHENFRFFATMNLGYYGTKELNQALFNRFNCVVELAALEDEAIIRMLEARVPECAKFSNSMLMVYNQIRNWIFQEELDIVISPRNLENWARLAKYEGYEKAAETTIIPIARKDESIEDTLRSYIGVRKWE